MGLAFIPTLAAASQATRFEKLQAVLDHLGVNDTRAYGEELRRFDGSQTRQGFETILKYMDPGKHLQHYLHWDDSRVVLYQDRDVRLNPDYSIELNPAGPPTD
ncbi:MAG: hypothetical protein HY075_16100, partial [Deltaproteobacteria bacterium]|nr:hypothetical protein [Deltaproteobacteria bacterium]